VRRVDRTRLAALVLVAVVAFSAAFLTVRALHADEPSSNAKVERVAAPLVRIANLERMATMKPMRSAPGAVPTPAQQPVTEP
jgi:hypothetical protein